MSKRREIALCIVLSIITCGIYNLYWLYKIQEDTLDLAKENGPSGGMVLLLTIVTCGIYSFYWFYVLGKRMDKITENVNGSSNIIYLVLSLCGLSLVAMALAQNDINQNAN